MNIFGIGLPEMAVIAAIGLLVFGPKRFGCGHQGLC